MKWCRIHGKKRRKKEAYSVFVPSVISPLPKGTLIFLCGGDEALFERTKGSMDGAMGKAAHFFGPVGAGSKMKLVVNMTMGTMMNSLVRDREMEWGAAGVYS